MIPINKKYNYQETSRTTVNGQRLYLTPDGQKLPSVTTILDRTKDKTHLIKWRQKVGNAEATRITTEAANVGTSMHSYLEHYLNGEYIQEKSNLVHQQGFKMAQVMIENGLSKINEIWGNEVSLYFPELYAGTTDGVGVFEGKEAIIDFKQTNKPKKEEWIEDYFLQLMLYMMAHNELFGTNIKTGVIMMCSRQLDYQEFILKPEDFNYWQDRACDRIESYYKLGY